MQIHKNNDKKKSVFTRYQRKAQSDTDILNVIKIQYQV